MNEPTDRPESSRPEYAGFYPVIAPLIMCEGVGDGKTTACVMAQEALDSSIALNLTCLEKMDAICADRERKADSFRGVLANSIEGLRVILAAARP